MVLPPFSPATFPPLNTFSPTREGRRCASLIDLVAVSPGLLRTVVACRVGDKLDCSDHRPVFVSWKVPRVEAAGAPACADAQPPEGPGGLPVVLEEPMRAHAWPRLRDLPPPPRRNWHNPLGTPTEFRPLPPFDCIARQAARLEEL